MDGEEDPCSPPPMYRPRHRNRQALETYNIEPEGGLGKMSHSPDFTVRDSRNRRIRKRVQNLALKMLLEDDSDENNSFDDLSDDSQKNESKNILAFLGALLSKGSRSNPTIHKEDIEKEDAGEIQYRAEFYHYRKVNPYGIDYQPELQKTIMERKSIDIVRASRATGTNCFDVTSMYAIPEGTNTTDVAMISKAVLAELGTYINIRSRFLLDYLRHIVLYYPTVSFDSDELVLEEPFCMLLHYRQELKGARDSAEKAASKIDSADGDNSSTGFEHLTYLIDCLEQRYADSLSQEMLRNQACPAMCTYEWMWLLFKPGSVVYSLVDGVLEAFIVEEHDRDARKAKDHKMRPRKISTMDDLERTRCQESLHVTVWYLAFNGKHLGRRREKYNIPKFDGEKSIISLPIFPQDFLKQDKRVHESLSTQEYLLHRGQQFFEMTRRSYRHYDGVTANAPKRTVRLTLELREPA